MTNYETIVLVIVLLMLCAGVYVKFDINNIFSKFRSKPPQNNICIPLNDLNVIENPLLIPNRRKNMQPVYY